MAYRTGLNKVIYQTREKGIQIRNKDSIVRMKGREQRDAEAEMFRGNWMREDGVEKLSWVPEERREEYVEREMESREGVPRGKRGDVDAGVKSFLGIADRDMVGVKPERASLRRYRRVSLRPDSIDTS